VIDRRRFLRGAALASAAALLPRPGLADDGAEVDACWATPFEAPVVKPTVCVSLDRLFKDLAVGNMPRLTNVHRIDGYYKSGSDIVFFGQSIEGMPELLFDDLVIAIRSQHGSYNRTRGAVSLDWLIDADSRPTTGDQFAQQSRRASDLVNESQDADFKARDLNYPRFKKACQQVSRYPRVLGMPRNCITAKILLDADYRMKEVAPGHTRLLISSPFKSPKDAFLEVAKQKLARGETPPDTYDGRLWFDSGKTSFGDVGQAYSLNCAQVVLRDQLATPNTFVRKFTCDWTNRMEEVIKSELIWRLMANSFRLFALAKMLEEHRSIDGGSYRQMLFNGYTPPEVTIARQYPPRGTSIRSRGARAAWPFLPAEGSP
jgi:hypothetical protein